MSEPVTTGSTMQVAGLPGNVMRLMRRGFRVPCWTGRGDGSEQYLQGGQVHGDEDQFGTTDARGCVVTWAHNNCVNYAHIS